VRISAPLLEVLERRVLSSEHVTSTDPSPADATSRMARECRPLIVFMHLGSTVTGGRPSSAASASASAAIPVSERPRVDADDRASEPARLSGREVPRLSDEESLRASAEEWARLSGRLRSGGGRAAGAQRGAPRQCVHSDVRRGGRRIRGAR